MFPRLLCLALLISLVTIPATAVRGARSTPPDSPGPFSSQFGDPYSEFRGVRYSNSGLLSESEEVTLGAKLHREVTKKYNLTDTGLDRVNQIGPRVARQSLRPGLTYKFNVIQSREINAFSLPGGRIYVTTALLRMANNDELASVLSHEVGHVVARHSLKSLKQSEEYNDIAKSLGELTGVAGDTARDLGVALGRMVGNGFLTIHTRDQEREADFLGVRALVRAGFDAQGMVTMFQKLQRAEAEDASLLGSLFSDHPDAQERIDNTRYEIGLIKRGR